MRGLRWVSCLVMVLMTFVCLPGGLRADDAARLTAAVAAAGYQVPPAGVIRGACDADPLCMARFLRDRIGAGAEIIPDENEDARHAPGWAGRRDAVRSVIRTADGLMILDLAAFDATAVAAAVDGAVPPPRRLALDLRAMDETDDLDAMRRVAALFIGSRDRAFRVRHSTGREIDWNLLKPLRSLSVPGVEVWIGAKTKASAEVFAMLMKLHAGARVLGAPSGGAVQLHKRVPITHGWVLLLPTGWLEVPGADLASGVTPDGPLEH